MHSLCGELPDLHLRRPSLAAREGMRLRRWDFVSAYLQGTLEEGETDAGSGEEALVPSTAELADHKSAEGLRLLKGHG